MACRSPHALRRRKSGRFSLVISVSKHVPVESIYAPAQMLTQKGGQLKVENYMRACAAEPGVMLIDDGVLACLHILYSERIAMCLCVSMWGRGWF